MPWTVNKEYLKKFGAIVFNTDPNDPFDLESDLNEFNLIDSDRTGLVLEHRRRVLRAVG